MGEWDLEAITETWQQRWWDARIHEAVGPGEKGLERGGSTDGPPRGAGAAAEARPTFFIHFAYPGISGYLHVGHMRGFTYSDVLARYKKQTGYDVLFPAGFHASGIPAVAFAKEVERGEKTEYLRANGYDGDIEALTDPRAVVDYFAHVYTHEYWKKFGFLIDDRRNCTTIDEGYQAFIQWQFRRLNDLGYLIEKPHYAPYCPVTGPVAVDKSETDIKQGGTAEIQEFVALRFTIPAGGLVDTDDDLDRIVLPCATLRPETVYGVTNLWVHPEHDYELVRVWRDGAVADDDPSEVWLVSRQGRTKLEWQMERAEALDVTVRGVQILGMTATAPVTGAEVPIVQGTFVDPMIATGIVMSVPGHAPFDWAAYVDAGLLETLGDPPRIVDVPGYDDLPARVACTRHGVTSQADAEALQAATEEVYADEFNKGVLTAACGPYAGQRIKAVKDRIREDFTRGPDAVGVVIRQFSEPVISRAGEVVDIRRIPDQNFIHYADEAWTKKTLEHAKTMRIHPQRYQDDFPNVLRWFGDRACVRRGAWLGTRFPFKEDWIIEPIADSTFYSWYYLVSPYVARGELDVGDLSDAFFDYVFNGRGAGAAGEPPDVAGVKAEVWRRVRADVLHYGPVDVNLGGKEHQTVHFPVWTMNNVALLDDPAMWPRGIFVNWWVTQKREAGAKEGAKISKSKGGAEPIPGAVKTYGVDPMRLYYCHVGSPHVDIEWDPEIVLSYRQRIERITRIADEALGATGSTGPMDVWLEAAFTDAVRTAREAFEAFDLRSAATALAYTVPDVLRWYGRRGGDNATLLRCILRDWARALCPLVPHIAEEMYARAGGEGLCSVQPFPDPEPANTVVLDKEAYLKEVLEDVQTVCKLADVDAPERLVLYTTPAWKRDVTVRAMEAAEAAEGKFPMGAFMETVMRDPDLRARGKEVQKFCSRLPGQVNQFSMAQRRLLRSGTDEAELLRAAASFLAAEAGVPEVQVFPADDPDAPVDPKQNVAAPLKPGIALL